MQRQFTKITKTRKGILLILGLLTLLFSSAYRPTGSYDCLVHSYGGKLGQRRLQVVINQATFNSLLSLQGTLSGYNTVGQTTRPIKGTFKVTSRGRAEVLLQEPGGQRNDGAFRLVSTCYGDGTARLSGTWECYRCELPAKTVVLNAAAGQ